VALDGHALLVGAPGRALLPSPGEVTWDFETGDVRGWAATGGAFAGQPTAGGGSPTQPDACLSGDGGLPPGRTRHTGRYWLSSCGVAPAESAAPPAGSDGDAVTARGGDTPTGTLTSPPFRIDGTTVSLLVGGGCDARRVYVELVVDGVPVHRATGACAAGLDAVAWDVARFAGSVGVLRVVDGAAGGPWGYVSVDDVRFDWDVAASGSSTHGAGAAYVFARVVARGADGETGHAARCPAAAWDTATAQCAWQLEAELRPMADRPGGTRFGTSVGVDDAAGLAVVAAFEAPPRAPHAWQSPDDADSQPASARALREVHTGDRAYRARQAHVLGDAQRRTSLLGEPAHDSGDDDEREWPDAGAGRAYADDVEAAYRATGLSRRPGGRAERRTGAAGAGREWPGAGATAAAEEGGVGGLAVATGMHRALPPAGGGGAAVEGAPSPRAPPGARPALFVFRSWPEVRAPTGTCGAAGCASAVVQPRLWPPSPHSVLLQPGAGAGDGGRAPPPAAALWGYTALLGVPMPAEPAAGPAPRRGAAWAFDVSHVLLSADPRDVTALRDAASASSQAGGDGERRSGFTVVVPENATAREVAIPVYRYHAAAGAAGALPNTRLHVQYATRDGSARGVSARHAAHCSGLAPAQRGGARCGDYVHSAGTLTFPPGATRRDVLVPLVDDECAEAGSEHFTVELWLPGGHVPLGGRGGRRSAYRVTVRIDDDDDDGGNMSAGTCDVPAAALLPPREGEFWCAHAACARWVDGGGQEEA
jgi:hypothetical protein